MGDGRRQARRRQQRRPRDPRRSTKSQPTEGKRLQLTIDYDVQKAIEDGFDGVGLQRRGGRARSAQRRRARRSPAVPAYDPNAFAAGHRSRDLGVAEHRRAAAAAGPRDSGPLFARVDVQDGGRRSPALEEGIITPDFKVHCAGGANFYGRHFKCWKKGGHGIDRSAARDRAVVRRVLLHRRQHARRRQDQQVGDAARPRREERHRSAERSARASCRRPSGSSEQMHEKWYAGETISVGDRAGRRCR